MLPLGTHPLGYGAQQSAEACAPLNLAFATRSVPMHGRSPWDGGLGGSESALVFLARGLAERGHHVTVYTICDAPGEYDGVVYAPIAALDEGQRALDFDVFVSLRFPDLVERDVRAGLRMLWCQDLQQPGGLRASAPWVDRFLFVSEWHRAHSISASPELGPIAAVLPNGIDLRLVPPAGARDEPPLFVHLSRPERGLGPLLAAWPEIRGAVPGAQLRVARYRSFYEPLGSQLEAFCLQADEAVRRTEGAAHLGHLSKPELYALLSRATVMLYPAEFDETSCIAAIEAQACGCPVVATRRGALPETLAPEASVLVEPGPHLPARFASAVVALAWDHEARAAMAVAGRERAKRHDALQVALRFEQIVAEALDARPPTSGVASVRAARWPGVREPLWRALVERVGPWSSLAVVGDAELASRFEVASGRAVVRATREEVLGSPPPEACDVVVDIGGLPSQPDAGAWLRGLARWGRRVVHLLPDAPDFLAPGAAAPTYHAIAAWFGAEADLACSVEAALPWGAPARAWLVTWRPRPGGSVPLPARDVPLAVCARARPRAAISACLIVRDAEETLWTTLRSVEPVVDEIRVLDTGSRDGTWALIQAFAGSTRVPVRAFEAEWPHDFAAARNQSVAGAEGDWILWIDADERLVGGAHLPRLAQSPLYEAYAIRQHNHIFDVGATHVEIPFRMYRNGRGYRFFGAVHEHPERTLNEPIEPWIVAPGVDILHYGYLTEAGRRRKLLDRNLALLQRDLDLYPGRQLSIVLYLRDAVNLSRFDTQRGSPVREDHVAALRAAVERFEERFFPERGRFYHLGRPYYDDALQLLGEGTPLSVRVGTGGAERTHWFRRPDDAVWIAGLAVAEHVNRGPGGRG